MPVSEVTLFASDRDVQPPACIDAEPRSMAQTLDNSNTQSNKGSQINSHPPQSVEPQPLIQSNIRVSCRVIRTNGFLGREHEGQEDEMRDRKYSSSTCLLYTSPSPRDS